MTKPEEIEVNVRQLDEEQATSANGTESNPVTPLFDVVRRMILAGFGAFALTRDEAEQFLNRLVERGEIAQKDAQQLIDETLAKFRQASVPPTSQVESNVNNLSHQVETGLEQMLNRMNIPSKRDIDELSAKIAQLAARVEELRRAGDTPAAKPQVKGEK
ncbi:phasin family protein [Candidatus Viridilinea mediisalina]|uniref:Poly(Hydroxyalkanoate) granule-associated protein n=1 Tax=Candidatus Viridilinea mediisalina TaxID=2024553 RepID=A0A2A6RFJ0_9CHLR|nr:phasin family protein [Candidatus Viridilinea mediisalina]PDW01701.1 poly(hydroxyalkanoate) granule-associated protein [Candidatus Viridilinea mediisalina]